MSVEIYMMILKPDIQRQYWKSGVETAEDGNYEIIPLSA
jgi:hypothetical protein